MWLGEDGPLMDKVTMDILENIYHAKVKDFVDSTDNWRWELFQELLPHSILVKIAAVCPLREGAPLDFVIWSDATNSNFSTKSAYARLEKDN